MLYYLYEKLSHFITVEIRGETVLRCGTTDCFRVGGNISCRRNRENLNLAAEFALAVRK